MNTYIIRRNTVNSLVSFVVARQGEANLVPNNYLFLPQLVARDINCSHGTGDKAVERLPCIGRYQLYHYACVISSYRELHTTEVFMLVTCS